MLSAQLWIRFLEMWAHGQGWTHTGRTENARPRVEEEQVSLCAAHPGLGNSFHVGETRQIIGCE